MLDLVLHLLQSWAAQETSGRGWISQPT